MIHTQVLIIGAGPAGLKAAQMACEAGLQTILVDRDTALGGQLRKQTHKFFGSQAQYAHMRGTAIAKHLSELLSQFDCLTILTQATVVGLYNDKVATLYHHHTYKKIAADAIILACGASEKALAFENNDLPNIMGAGALQTLVNVYHVVPGKRIVMIGSGNIGLIVAYQMVQAGMQVQAVIEAQAQVGGYHVHAAKLQRLGVPLLLNHTIQRAMGKEKVEAIEVVRVDAHLRPVAGTATIIETNVVCIAVGLSPLHHLASMLRVKTAYIARLGGLVPLIDDTYQTSVAGVYACGDMVGIEEASSALMEGSLAGLYVAKACHQPHPHHDTLVAYYNAQLKELRCGPLGLKTRLGLAQAKEMWFYGD